MHLKGQRLPGRDRIWIHLTAMGIIHIAIPFVLVAWGSLSIDSGLAAMITSTAPLFTIILAHLWAADDRINPAKLLGVMVAFSGMFVLLSPSFANGLTASFAGVLAVLGASICYAIGNVYTHKYLRGLPSLVGPTGQLLVATAVLLPISLFLERPFQMPLPTFAVLLAWIGAAVLSTALAFIVFYRLLEIASATYVGMVSYLIPIVGAVLGLVFLGEQLSSSAYIGFSIILSGVIIANGLAVPRLADGLHTLAHKLNSYPGRLTGKGNARDLPVRNLP
jgi:drug/metabolite transporter (DMT)-like permease